MLRNRDDAYILLETLNAPGRLLRHVRLVGEAADLLIAAFETLGIAFDADRVRIGVAIHDVGKILHPEELDAPGSRHEPDGRDLMIRNGVAPDIAQFCVSHARWADPGTSFEELLVALSDKLWKGARVERLELLVIDAAASGLNADRWEIFTSLDSIFEHIAAGAQARLARS